ncbi:MAG: DUF1844 domain-containing protein [Planctomycetota bacterium]
MADASEPSGQPEQPKLIIDDDWKAEAQKEKERLSSESQAASASGGDPGSVPGQPQMPEASFDELLRTFAMPALMYLGQIPDPQSGKAVVAPDIAKLHIDLLGVLEEKTKGNLSEEESSVLTRTLSELRMAYVEIVKAVEQAIAEGKIDPNAPGGMPSGIPGGGPGGVGPIA